uniref:G/T mismatch-specific thymine DNA glycosylase-like n=1 Tax=Osmia lignaria TaxID=473952 RepID=UPI0014795219|nr:G/T mismatch-specific thymine DNA glycosylase-like [Osmia lignaria]
MILRSAMCSLTLSKLKKKIAVEKLDKPKKKIDRFDGLSEEEVQKHTLPDYLEMNLDMVFVGINPGLMAAYRGRYYAGPGNHFYKLLYESGLTPRCLTYEEDYKLLRYGIGLTNIVERATKSSADLKRTELKEGSKIVEEKLLLYRPKIAVFNGKCIYEVFANKTGNFNLGLQPECIGDVAIWVTPSSSARCANFPRMSDKLHFFTSLKKYLQFLKGEVTDVDTKEFSFEGKCKQFIPRTSKMWRRKNVSAFLHGGRVANKDTICLDTSDVAIAHSTEFIVDQVQSVGQETDEKEEITSLDNSVACISQDSVKTFFENNSLSQTEHFDPVSGSTDSEKNFKSETTISKVRTNVNKKKRSVKRLSQKPAKTRDYCRNNPDSDFVNIIKQRLMNKVENNSDEESDIENK